MTHEIHFKVSIKARLGEEVKSPASLISFLLEASPCVGFIINNLHLLDVALALLFIPQVVHVMALGLPGHFLWVP